MRKKLFAVIMSAMMMITFMPTMAFAAGTPGWNDTFTSWTSADGNYTFSGNQIVRTWDDTDGYITATIDTNQISAGQITASGYDSTNDDATYYDLAGAEIGAAGTNVLYSTMTYDEFTTAFPQTAPTTDVKLVLVQPSNTVNAGDGNYVAGRKTNAVSLIGYTVTVPTPDTTSKDAQTYNLVATVTPGVSTTNALVNAGTSIAKSISVGAGSIAAPGYEFILDGKNTAANTISASGLDAYDPYYDGAEHEITVKSNSNVSVSMKMWNATTAKWEDVNSIKYKDAATYNLKLTVKTTAAGGGVTTVGPTSVDFEVQAVTFDGFSFLESGLVNGTSNFMFNVEDDYKVADYVEAYAEVTDPTAPTDAEKAGIKAVKANKDLLLEYFNDFYEFESKEVTEALGSTTVNADKTYIKAKDLTALTNAEKDALVAKYALLLNNFDVTTSRSTIATLSSGEYELEADLTNPAYFIEIANTKDNDVDFLGGATKKVHIKNAKKIKSAKKVTIKAESESGVDVTFKKLSGNSKIKVASNGKVTLKKGLKKGTYSVRVKASVKAGKGFKYAKAYRTYKFKVVK